MREDMEGGEINVFGGKHHYQQRGGIPGINTMKSAEENHGGSGARVASAVSLGGGRRVSRQQRKQHQRWP
jgi:hypothetical protein